MKVTLKLVRSRAKSPLQSCQYLDLSNLELDNIGKLNGCVKLTTLILRNNNIFCCTNVDVCEQLWKLDLANNQIDNLDGFQRFIALGTLILSNNSITWSELAKIRHMHILNLSLYGNQQLDQDHNYRLHVIDCLPHIWMLDGKIITSAEREQVRQFFEDTATTDHPVRRKLGKDAFIPTPFKSVQVNGVHGERTEHFMKRFPLNGSLNVGTDFRRIRYLAHNLHHDIAIENKNNMRWSCVFGKQTNCLEDMVLSHKEDPVSGNMLLVLLVASLEFALPMQLVEETINKTLLNKFQGWHLMNLFLMPREVRCQVTMLLLSTVKVVKDTEKDDCLYDKLYIAIYQTVSTLAKLSHGCLSKNLVADLHGQREARCLIASEIVQLFCVVPLFYFYMQTDAGLKNLITVATADATIVEKISLLLGHQENEKIIQDKLCREVERTLTTAIHQATLSIFLTHSAHSGISTNTHILKTHQAIPRRPQTAISASDYHMAGRTSPHKKAARIKSGKVERRGYVPCGRLGDKVLLGPQNIGRVISVPEPDLALVQMDVIPAESGAMVIQQNNPEEHYTYLDMNTVYFDQLGSYWRLKGSSGDRITLQNGDSVSKELLRNTHQLAKCDSYHNGLTPPPVSPRSQVASICNDLLQVTGHIPTPRITRLAKSKCDKEIPIMVSTRYKELHDLSLTFNRQSSSTELHEGSLEHSLRKNCTVSIEDGIHSRSYSAVYPLRSDSGVKISRSKQGSSKGIFKERSRSGRSLAQQEEDLSEGQLTTASLFATLQTALGNLNKGQVNALSNNLSKTPSHTQLLRKSTSDLIGTSSDIREQQTFGTKGSGYSSCDDEEDEILYQAPTLLCNRTPQTHHPQQSRRSSLESTDEGELCHLVTESRPGTAHSRKSMTGLSDLALHGTPDCPIEIPQVSREEGTETDRISRQRLASTVGSTDAVCGNEEVIVETNDTSEVMVEINETEVREKLSLQSDEKLPFKSTSVNMTGRSTTSLTKQDINLPQSVHGPRSFSTLDTYRMVVTKELYTSQYQRLRTDAWRSVPKTASRPTSPPPQPPPSPYTKQEENLWKPVRVSQGDSWLAAGKDLFWEKLQQRPNTAHSPGWLEGLHQRHRPTSAAAVRALRRSRTPKIQTPSSMAYDKSQYGHCICQSMPDIASLGDSNYYTHSQQLSQIVRSSEMVPGSMVQSHPRARSAYFAKQEQGRVCEACQQQRAQEMMAVKGALGANQQDLISILNKLEPCMHEDDMSQTEAASPHEVMVSS